MLSDRKIKREYKRKFMKEFQKEPEEEVYEFGGKPRKIEEVYKTMFELAEHEAEDLNKFNHRFKSKYISKLVRCTYLKDEEIYQYTVDESAVMQESYEIYVREYLKTHQL